MSVERKDAMDWTPGAMFRDIAEVCDKTDTECGVAITLDRGADGDQYDIRFRNAGLKNSEVVALLEIIKGDLIKMINGG